MISAEQVPGFSTLFPLSNDYSVCVPTGNLLNPWQLIRLSYYEGFQIKAFPPGEEKSWLLICLIPREKTQISKFLCTMWMQLSRTVKGPDRFIFFPLLLKEKKWNVFLPTPVKLISLGISNIFNHKIEQITRDSDWERRAREMRICRRNFLSLGFLFL